MSLKSTSIKLVYLFNRSNEIEGKGTKELGKSLSQMGNLTTLGLYLW